MNWEIVASTGEWAGAIAVVATLFYLARQIQQQNQIARYNAWESIFQGFNQNNQLIASSPEVAELALRGINDPEKLSDSQSAQWLSLYRTYFNHMQRAYKAYQLGYLTDDEWGELARSFAAESKEPGPSKFRKGHEQFMPEFWSEIDNRYDDNFKVIDYRFVNERDA